RGRVRHADLVRVVSHAGADDGVLPAARETPGDPRHRTLGTVPPRVRSGLRAHSPALRVRREHLHRASWPLTDLRRAHDYWDDSAAVRRGRGFLSDSRCRTHEASRTRTWRNADRTHRGNRRRYRALDPANYSCRRA